ncbi:hypothetical protein D6853_04740 [Butyrivibrio sp. X503]|uniref:zinc-ribbon domain-containing protein n=1 Tax=Butyrivibrio sp. X503 TaxID=2364878 RepID=UPI000EAA9622|nr:zinc-ribbon domain-containing protein [Butyrivibrio sp. X503]RKM57325.1 hypothetical protein D6853_04740 [Butyrivibrio sp. X503]
MRCNNCGNELNEGTKYCSICGFPIEQAQKGNNIVQQPVQPSSKWGGASTALKHKTEIIVLASIIGVLILSAVIFAIIYFGSGFEKPGKFVASNTAESSGVSSSDTDEDDAKASDSSEADNTTEKSVSDIGKWEVSHITITEIDGVLYNNQGLSSDEFKDNIEECYFSKDSSVCAVLDKQNNLYFVRGDLSSELLEKGSFAVFSGDNSCLIYLNNASIKRFDCQTSETTFIAKADSIDETAISPNGEFIAFLHAEHKDGDTKYNYYVYSKDGTEVSCTSTVIAYRIEGVSNDGKKIYFQSYALGEGAVYCLKDGEFIRIEGSEDHGRAYFDFAMDNALIEKDDAIYYFSSETCKSEKIASGKACAVYPKRYYNNYITAVMYDSRLEGCVIEYDDKFYWIDDKMELIAISDECLVSGCDFVGGADGKYRFLYQGNKNIHLITYDNGATDDKLFYQCDSEIFDIAADPDYNEVWISSFNNEIYHITESGAEKIGYDNLVNAIRIAYDMFCERIVFCGDDKKVAYKDSDGNIITIREDCEYVGSQYPFSSKTVCTDSNGKHYIIYGNLFVEDDEN